MLAFYKAQQSFEIGGYRLRDTVYVGMWGR